MQGLPSQKLSPVLLKPGKTESADNSRDRAVQGLTSNVLVDAVIDDVMSTPSKLNIFVSS
jgi:hypothetical protein